MKDKRTIVMLSYEINIAIGEHVESKFVTWDDVKHGIFKIDTPYIVEDKEGTHIRIDIVPAERKKFLFVSGRGIDLDNATSTDIKNVLEDVRGREFAAQVFLQNVPNRFGTSCMMSRSSVYALLDGVSLPPNAGDGARIVEEYLND